MKHTGLVQVKGEQSQRVRKNTMGGAEVKGHERQGHTEHKKVCEYDILVNLCVSCVWSIIKQIVVQTRQD